MPLPPLTSYANFSTPVRSYLCLTSATAIKDSLLRSIHSENRKTYSLVEPQFNKFEHPWGEWNRYDTIYVYQEIYGTGTGFILFFSQEENVTSSVGAFLQRKDVLKKCVQELLEGKMVRVGRILCRGEKVGKRSDWHELTWQEVERQDGLLREKIDGLDGNVEYEIEEADEESDEESKKIADIIRREGKPVKDRRFAERSLERE